MVEKDKPTEMLNFRLTKKELEVLQLTSKILSLPLGSFIRSQALQRARIILKENDYELED